MSNFKDVPVGDRRLKVNLNQNLKQEMVTIPMDLLEHVDFPDEIKKIEINGFSSSDTKMIYFKNE